MNYLFDSRLGERLYRLLPEVYRTRDRKLGKVDGVELSHDLARYLDAQGHLLDLIHGTLQQQLKDALPGTSQDWLIPYFAQLVAANIVSPDSAGKHEEVANAVGWRQRKGTLKCAEQIAEAVGQVEVEIHEGWQRVAITPRVDRPIRPFRSWDSSLDLDMEVAHSAIRHPSLPAVMLDLRRPSRAIESTADNPASRSSEFGGVRQTWRQANRHGTPCFPGSYDDVSRRTADLRSPGAKRGLYHPRRLLAFAPPPTGLVGQDPYRITWAQRVDSLYAHLIEDYFIDGIWTIRNKTDRIIEISDKVDLPMRAEIAPGVTVDVGLYRVEGIDFLQGLEVESGGRLELERVQAGLVRVDTPAFDHAAIKADQCLFDVLSSGGLVQLEGCSVLKEAHLTSIEARNSLLLDLRGSEIDGQLEYCGYPAGAPVSDKKMTVEDCTTDIPLFFLDHETDPLAARAVLAPGTPATIYEGASNGGEIGYFHRGRDGRPVKIEKNFIDGDALVVPAGNRYVLRDLIFDGEVTVDAGGLILLRSAVKTLTVKSGRRVDANDVELPVLDALDCVFDTVKVNRGLARFEYCTIMRDAHCRRMQASDSLFTGAVTDGAGGEPRSGCIRYSRIPRELVGENLNLRSGPTDSNTRELPVFVQLQHCSGGPQGLEAAGFGKPGYGVLDPVTADAIRFGAEDGGEMGVGHHRYYSLKAEAMLDKMREFLPIGIEPVLIHDQRLLRVPPEIEN